MATPSIEVVAEGRRYVFEPGAAVSLGRAPETQVTLSEHRIGRTHAWLGFESGHWYLTDAGSRNGTWVGGQQVDRVQVVGELVARLGNPVDGTELRLRPLAAATQTESMIRWLRWGAGAAVALVLVVGATTWFVGRGKEQVAADSDQAAAVARDALWRVRAATVRLTPGVDPLAPSGSGTVISADGLILTSAHIAAPLTPGVAVATGTAGDALEPNPEFLTVSLAPQEGKAAVPRYRAGVVAVDGYLDLAVLAITADQNGTPIDRSTLDLPFVDVMRAAQPGEPVTVLGYPLLGTAEPMQTVSAGKVTELRPDPLRHVVSPQFLIETSAPVGGQDTGGPAVNDRGDLVGVASTAVSRNRGDTSRTWRLRAASLAQPLVDAARAGTPYQPVPLVAATAMQATAIGLGLDEQSACMGNGAIPAGTPVAFFGFSHAGAPPGVDVAFRIVAPDQRLINAELGIQDSLSGLPVHTINPPESCVSIQVTSVAFGTPMLPPGQYSAQLLAGPNLEPVGAAVPLRIGDGIGI